MSKKQCNAVLDLLCEISPPETYSECKPFIFWNLTSPKRNVVFYLLALSWTRVTMKLITQVNLPVVCNRYFYVFRCVMAKLRSQVAMKVRKCQRLCQYCMKNGTVSPLKKLDELWCDVFVCHSCFRQFADWGCDFSDDIESLIQYGYRDVPP